MPDEKDLPDLTTLDGFNSATQLKDQDNTYRNVGKLHCPTCGDSRRVHAAVLLKRDGTSNRPPVLMILMCVQCDTSFTAVVYDGPEGRALAVLPSTYGGLTTPHTPKGVAYYLDQAQRSQATGANSAAVAMFRGALEHLLFEQGFKNGTCGTKLKELEKAIADGTAPKWARELDGEFLQVMKQLGDGAIHPGDGDIKKQAVLDVALIAQLTHTFQMLLFTIYELPHEKQKRLAGLKAGIIKK
jgi:hypothetical protein